MQYFYMRRNKKTARRAFTLIELLVVISIVSLLSSIVLAALQSARTKGDDAQRNEIILEYTKALALYFHENNGAYPTAPDTTFDYCLGDFSDDLCGASNATSEDAAIINAVKTYYPSMPTSKPVGSYEGPLYRCTTVSGTTCTQARITWRLQQTTTTCVRGATRTTGSSYTQCQLTLN